MFARVPRLLHRRGRDAGHRDSVRRPGGQVADDEDLGVAGDRQVGLDEDPAGPVERHAERPAEPRPVTPAAQSTVRVAIRSSPILTPSASIAVTSSARPDVDARGATSCLRAFSDSVRRVGRQDAVGALEQDHTGLGRVDAPEVARQRMLRDLAERAGELDPRGSAADDDEREPGPARSPASVSRSAPSNAERTRRRISSASPMLFRPGAIGVQSSCPK